MNAIRPKGWCPTLYAPMESGDGLLVRVRPPGGMLPASAARLLADAARRHGSGMIELTNRASIQMRGLRPGTLAPFATAMVAARLAHPEPAAERRRAVIAPPLSGHDPRAAFVVRALEAMLERETRLASLPGKFGVLVDAGGVLPIGSAPADIRVMLGGGRAYLLLDGADLAAACAPEDIPDAVARLAAAFLTTCGPHRRMRALVADLGADCVFAAAGLLPIAAIGLPPQPVAVGWLPDATGGGAFGVGLPFGATDATTLAALANLAERHGDGTLRATPWRAFVIAGVSTPGALQMGVGELGLIADPHDARARIAACPGAPFCPGATVPTRTDAARLAALGIAGSIHVSGCAKGCAHPGAAGLTLVGDAGRYAIVRNGRAGDAPTQAGLTITDLLESIQA